MNLENNLLCKIVEIDFNGLLQYIGLINNTFTILKPPICQEFECQEGKVLAYDGLSSTSFDHLHSSSQLHCNFPLTFPFVVNFEGKICSVDNMLCLPVLGISSPCYGLAKLGLSPPKVFCQEMNKKSSNLATNLHLDVKGLCNTLQYTTLNLNEF